MRLSTSSLAGTARTLVAVGTSSEASMFCTIRAATPRSVVALRPAGAAGALAAGFAGRAWPAAWPVGRRRRLRRCRGGAAGARRRRSASPGGGGAGCVGAGLGGARRWRWRRSPRPASRSVPLWPSPACSRRRNRARQGRRWSGRPGSAGTSRRRSTRSDRSPRVGCPAKSAGSTLPCSPLSPIVVSTRRESTRWKSKSLPGYALCRAPLRRAARWPTPSTCAQALREVLRRQLTDVPALR